MIHKKEGFPGKDWLCKLLRRYLDQRVQFEITPTSDWWKICTKNGPFDPEKPIYVSGVYCGIVKKPKDWPGDFGHSRGAPCLFMMFRSLIFIQGDIRANHPFARSHYDKRRQIIEFELSEIRGARWVERLRASIPRLGHSPGEISYSEGSLGRGFPSKKNSPSSPGAHFY